MTIAYVVKRYPRYSETFIVNEILAHEKDGLDLEIFSLLPPEDTHFQNIISRVRAPVTYLRTQGLRAADFWLILTDALKSMPEMKDHLASALDDDVRHVAQAAMLASRAKERHITHFHAHFATSASLVARLASKFSGIPFSFTAHAKDIFHEDVDDAMFERLLNDAKYSVTISDFNYDFLKQKYPKSTQNLVRLYNGIDTNEFKFQNSDRRPDLIVAVGRLVEKKGFDDLIRAISLLKNKTTQCKIVGSGDQYESLLKLISELGLTDQVALTGPLPQSQVYELLKAATVFVAPCVVGGDGNRDGMPTVLLEAMATGAPCVATDVTAIPELIAHNHTGLLVKERDTKSLADAIEKIMSSREFAASLGVNARKKIETDFDIAINAAKLRKLFVS